MAGSSFISIQEPTGASVTNRLDTWTIDRGGSTLHREVMVLGGSASDGLLFAASGAPSAGGLALPVWPVNSSGGFSSNNPLHVFMQGSTATQTVQGNVSAAISGNTTAVVANSSGGITSGNPLHVFLQGSTATVSIQGNTSAVVANSSGTISTGNPLAVFLQGSTAVVTVQGNVSAAISGNTTAVIGNSSGVFTTGNPLPVYLQGSTATVTVQGNVSAAVAGNVSAVITALPGTVQINTSAGSTAHLVAGADGNTSNSTARVLKVNASQELVITGAVTVAGNASVQGNVSAVISGNSTAVISNTSGNITTANPLAVFVQGSTATVTVQGNVSAAISGNATVAISTATPAYIAFNGTSASGGFVAMGLDGTATNSTARPLQVDASGKLKVDAGAITVGGLAQINTSGGSTMMLVGGQDGGTSNSTARTLNVNASRELLITGAVTVAGNTSVVGNVSAVITTAWPAYIAFNGTTASGGVIMMGVDGTATNATARPLIVNSSGELKTAAGAVTVGGLVQINTSGGTTMMLVGGVDGGTSNSTARALRVNSSGELLTVGGTVTVPGGGVINTTAGTSGLLMLGADGNTSNSTARYLQVNASQELIVKGTIVGNTSVVGNVSAIITTAQAIQVEAKSGAVFPISGNATVTISTAIPWYIPFGGATASGGIVVMGLDGTATNSTARPLQVDASGKLKVDAGSISVGGLAQINASGGSTMMLVGGADGNTSVSTARALQVNSSQELIVKGTIVGNTSVVGNVSAIVTAMPGTVVLNGTAGTTGLLVYGADGTATNSTVRPFQINASGELLIRGGVSVVGNASVVGNVSAVISGNSTAVLSTAGMGGSTASPVYIAAAQQLGQIYQGTTALAPQFSSINVTASGISAIITSATGAIYVLAVQFSAKTSCTVQWFEATTSGITGVQAVAGDGGFVLPYNPVGWFKTASGLPLSLGVQGSSGGVGGSIVYARPAS